mmetsp:Transcript_1842/g.4647  ORF Transcript_1842/g.4647 Transcript_1842/m.4647 type:complete len:230 (-) Transcript_1842:1301-1990(-)
MFSTCSNASSTSPSPERVSLSPSVVSSPSVLMTEARELARETSAKISSDSKQLMSIRVNEPGGKFLSKRHINFSHASAGHSSLPMPQSWKLTATWLFRLSVAGMRVPMVNCRNASRNFLASTATPTGSGTLKLTSPSALKLLHNLTMRDNGPLGDITHACAKHSSSPSLSSGTCRTNPLSISCASALHEVSLGNCRCRIDTSTQVSKGQLPSSISYVRMPRLQRSTRCV